MFRKLALSTLFLVAGLVLAGCAIERVGPPQDPNEVVNTPPPGVGTPDTATTTTPPTPTVPLSPRANIIMKVGEPGTLCPDLYCPTEQVVFTVDKIATPLRCTEQFADKPEHGHLIAVHMTDRTTAALAPGQAANLSISSFAFSIVGPTASPKPAWPPSPPWAASAKTPNSPRDYSPSSQYAGTIVLDSRYATGTLVFKPILRIPTGWEWAF